jgi:hypothetical protein
VVVVLFVVGNCLQIVVVEVGMSFVEVGMYLFVIEMNWIVVGNYSVLESCSDFGMYFDFGNYFGNHHFGNHSDSGNCFVGMLEQVVEWLEQEQRLVAPGSGIAQYVEVMDGRN